MKVIPEASRHSTPVARLFAYQSSGSCITLSDRPAKHYRGSAVRIYRPHAAAADQWWRAGPSSANSALRFVRMTASRPVSIPEGLVVELSRGKVLPGASGEADRWMQMLNDRVDECVASLDRERMAIEIVFRLKENGEDYLYWVSVHGPNDGQLDLTRSIDRDHLAQAKRTKHPGWVEAEPQVLMLPDPVRQAVLSWALRAQDDSH